MNIFDNSLSLEPLTEKDLGDLSTTKTATSIYSDQSSLLLQTAPETPPENNGEIDLSTVDDESRIKIKHTFGDRLSVEYTSPSDGTETFGAVDNLTFTHTISLPMPCQQGQTVDGTAASEELSGTEGNDTIWGEGGNDTLNGGSCNDIIFGWIGNDNLNGNAGADVLLGEAGIDRLDGGSGSDILSGGDDIDQLFGGLNEDFISGGQDDDSLYGQEGDDFLNGDEGDDFLDGGDDNDRVWGGIGNDTVFGGGQNDILYGGKGNDTLRGQDGDDWLIGGNDNDLLVGSLGAFSLNEIDTLEGGAGQDTFVLNHPKAATNAYSSSSDQDYALILDFEVGVDTIQVSALQHGPTSYRLFKAGSRTYVSSFTAFAPQPSGISGIVPFGTSELIAVVEGTDQLSFSRDFAFA